MEDILIKTDSHYKVNRSRIRKLIELYLEERKVRARVEVSLSVIGDRQMKNLNRKFRNLDQTTDVLSFPLIATEKKSVFIDPPDNILRLGYIVVLYRKYRPQKLADLDIEEVRQKLEKTLSSPYLPHAYLFAGPKGTGKTSAARIVAKILNCEKIKGKTTQVEPCNRCDSCLSITGGRHFDVLEIDAASNRGIEEIRDLREKIKLVPVSGKFKVYIIDEVHMLTTEAFNALLKTLEEPPKHAVFVLATTEAERMPETIKSRCVTFSFRKAAVNEITNSLKRVTAGEGVKIDADIINEIAVMAEGSFRDATKMLEQVLSEKIDSREKLRIALGRDSVSAGSFLKLLKDKQIKVILQTIVTMAGQGIDLRFFVTDILNLLHSMLLDRYGLEQAGLSANLKGLYTSREISELIGVFSQVFQELKFASRPELPLETALVAWCEKGG